MCYQCGNLGKARTADGKNWCEDCWRLDIQPRLETHPNPVLPDSVQLPEQHRLGETWLSNYTTPQDIVQSAILVGVSTPNAFAKHKKWEPNGEEVVISESKKKPKAAHPKLISNKNSKRQNKERYRPPFMTRSEARKERAAAELKAVADDGLPMDLDAPAPADALGKEDDSNGGPGPSTIANATKKAHHAAEADATMDTDTPASESVTQQKGDPSPVLLATGITTAQESSSRHSNPKHPGNVPVWAQTPSAHLNSQPLNTEAPTFIPTAVPVKSSRHPEAKGPVHIPVWARATTTQGGPFQSLAPGATLPVAMQVQQTTTQGSAQYIDRKDARNLSVSAQNAALLGASTANTINAKDQRYFAQPRYSLYDDMDMMPPCALKIALKARSYSKKPAAPITYNSRGNSGNIIAMNYLKARQAFHQAGPNRKLGWYSTSTVVPDAKSEVNSVRAKTLASTRVQSDNSQKRRARDERLFALLLRKGSLTAGGCNKGRRIEEDSEEEFQGVSDRSKSPSAKATGTATLEELRAKAVSTNSCHTLLVATFPIARTLGFSRAPGSFCQLEPMLRLLTHHSWQLCRPTTTIPRSVKPAAPIPTPPPPRMCRRRLVSTTLLMALSRASAILILLLLRRRGMDVVGIE